MKKLKRITFLILSVGILFSCRTNQPTIKDWAGTYVGVLPCADCPGIRQQLTLNKDKTYTYSIKYLDRNEVPVRTLKGKFKFNGNKLTFIHPSDGGTYKFELKQGAIIYLDKQGEPIKGKLASKYVLKKQSATAKTAVKTHKSEPWEGKYFGVLPCADCGGIQYELMLNANQSYQLVTHYLTDDGKYDTLRGTFTWNADKTIVKLEETAAGKGAEQFKIEKNQVRYLDNKGKKIEGNLADKYVLKKSGNPKVEDKKWDLVTLKGKTITDTNTNHFFIEFHSKNHQLEVKANCNLISLGYQLLGGNQLKVKQGLSTLMACKDSQDKTLMQVVNKTKSLDLKDNKMMLINAKGETLAVFK